VRESWALTEKELVDSKIVVIPVMIFFIAVVLVRWQQPEDGPI
jgi:hypothetical protein